MRKLILLPALFLLAACSSDDKQDQDPPKVEPQSATVIEIDGAELVYVNAEIMLEVVSDLPIGDDEAVEWRVISTDGAAITELGQTNQSASWRASEPGLYVFSAHTVSDLRPAGPLALHQVRVLAEGEQNNGKLLEIKVSDADATIGEEITISVENAEENSLNWSLAHKPPQSSVTLRQIGSGEQIQFTPDVDGAYVFIVGYESDGVTLVPQITVVNVTGIQREELVNAQPTVVHRNGQFVGDEFKLSAMSDMDGVNYIWNVVYSSIESFSMNVVEETTTFTPTTTGHVVFSVTSVTDAGDFSLPTYYTANILRENSAPVATIEDLSADGLFTFSGLLSTDPEQDSLTYEWSIQDQPEGSALSILSNSSNLLVLQPEVPGLYNVALRVSDGELWSEVVTVEKLLNSTPTLSLEVSNIYDGQFLTRNKPVYVLANVVDADEQEINYAWNLVSTPEGSVADIQNASAERINILPDLIGEYTVSVTVNDGFESVTDEVAFIIENQAPRTGSISYSDYYPSNNEILIARVSREPTDNDGDELITVIKWLVNDEYEPTLDDVLEIDLSQYKPGDKLQAQMEVSDSFDVRTETYRAVTIMNNFPDVPESLTLQVSEGELVSYQFDYVDPDGDTIEYRLIDGVNGAEVSETGLLTLTAPNAEVFGYSTSLVRVEVSSTEFLAEVSVKVSVSRDTDNSNEFIFGYHDIYGSTRQFVDTNGNGKDEIVTVQNNKIWLSELNASRELETLWVSPYYWSSDVDRVVPLTVDGKKYIAGQAGQQLFLVEPFTDEPSVFVDAGRYFSGLHAIDVDGDGSEELVAVSDRVVYVQDFANEIGHELSLASSCGSNFVGNYDLDMNAELVCSTGQVYDLATKENQWIQAEPFFNSYNFTFHNVSGADYSRLIAIASRGYDREVITLDVQNRQIVRSEIPSPSYSGRYYIVDTDNDGTDDLAWWSNQAFHVIKNFDFSNEPKEYGSNFPGNFSTPELVGEINGLPGSDFLVKYTDYRTNVRNAPYIISVSDQESILLVTQIAESESKVRAAKFRVRGGSSIASSVVLDIGKDFGAFTEGRALVSADNITTQKSFNMLPKYDGDLVEGASFARGLSSDVLIARNGYSSRGLPVLIDWKASTLEKVLPVGMSGMDLGLAKFTDINGDGYKDALIYNRDSRNFYALDLFNDLILDSTEYPISYSELPAASIGVEQNPGTIKVESTELGSDYEFQVVANAYNGSSVENVYTKDLELTRYESDIIRSARLIDNTGQAGGLLVVMFDSESEGPAFPRSRYQTILIINPVNGDVVEKLATSGDAIPQGFSPFGWVGQRLVLVKSSYGGTVVMLIDTNVSGATYQSPELHGELIAVDYFDTNRDAKDDFRIITSEGVYDFLR